MLTFRWTVFEINHIKSKGSIAGYVTVDLTGFSQKAAKATVILKSLSSFIINIINNEVENNSDASRKFERLQSYHSVT